jgi:hypothetical protein
LLQIIVTLDETSHLSRSSVSCGLDAVIVARNLKIVAHFPIYLGSVQSLSLMAMASGPIDWHSELCTGRLHCNPER